MRFPDGTELTPLSNSHDCSTTDHFTIQHTTDFDTLTDFVYPDPNIDTRLLHDRAILATTNASIDASNDHITGKRAGSSATFYSSETLIPDYSNPNTAFASPEHLNNLNVQGVPPHALHLQSDALAMIIRNLNFQKGSSTAKKSCSEAFLLTLASSRLSYSHPREPSLSFLAFCFTLR